jgi:UDP-glucose:glycoprotein glucosyltransferase
MGTVERVLLPGYGVEAVLKNTEYSAMDEKDRDAERKSKGGGGGGEGRGTEEEEGAVSVCV